MKITDYPFKNSDSEYNRIKELLGVIEAHPEIDNNWEPGRMDGWRYSTHAGKELSFFEANAHYWQTESGQVVGLFISEYGKDDFFIVLHPDHWDLFSDVVRWGIEVWAKGKTKIGTEVYSFGKEKIEKLEGAGFYDNGHVENVRTYDLVNYDFSYEIKPGFQLVTFSDFGDYAAKVELVGNAFDNPNASEDRIRSLQASPNYNPDLDLMIVTREGQGAAYCTGWQEENNRQVGFIEPMGTHSDFRKNGFGKALAKETFKRLHQLGVETAWIASLAEPNISNFLYDSLNPETVKRSHQYSLDLEG